MGNEEEIEGLRQRRWLRHSRYKRESKRLWPTRRRRRYLFVPQTLNHWVHSLEYPLLKVKPALNHLNWRLGHCYKCGPAHYSKASPMSIIYYSNNTTNRWKVTQYKYSPLPSGAFRYFSPQGYGTGSSASGMLSTTRAKGGAVVAIAIIVVGSPAVQAAVAFYRVLFFLLVLG